MKLSKKDIINYYDACEKDYSLFWDLGRSLAMHAGYWDETTPDLHAALMRENEVLAAVAGISSHDHVLDAGCGVGGSAIFLAERFGCRVTGISLSAKQVETAKQHAARRIPANAPQFFTMDYTGTTFPKETFDVVWGLESICHADDKRLFIEEALRVLKPGGRLVVADGFLMRDKDGAMNRWLRGWGVNHLETVHRFEAMLRGSGFEDVRFRDITANVLPSSKRLYMISLPALIYSKVGEWLRFRSPLQTENIRSAYHQYRAMKKGLWKYGIFFGKKAETPQGLPLR